MHRATGQPKVVVGVLVALLSGIATATPPAVLAAGTISFASDSSWEVRDGDAAIGPDLALPGPAQPICLNDGAPPSCPDDAVRYGYAGSAWFADLSAIPGAVWVWAPGIDSTTQPSDDDTYEFTKDIEVPGVPVTGTILVGVDDMAEILVNGTSAGTVGGFDSLSPIDVTALLVEGSNTIAVRATNGHICGSSCPYAVNPAGVVFGGQIEYETPTPAPPTPAPTATPQATPTTAPTVEATLAPTVAPSPTPGPDAAPTGGAGGGIPIEILIALALLGILGAAIALIRISRRSRRS